MSEISTSDLTMKSTSQLEKENPLKLLLFEGFLGIINQTHTISFSISRRVDFSS